MSELPAGKGTPAAPEQPTGRRSWGLSAEPQDDDQQTRPLRLAARSAGMLNDEDSPSDGAGPALDSPSQDSPSQDSPSQDSPSQDSKESPVADATDRPEDQTDEAPGSEGVRTTDTDPQAGAAESGADKPGADGSRADKPGGDKPGGDKPGADESGGDKPGAGKSGAGADRSEADKPGAKGPERNTDEKSLDGKNLEEKEPDEKNAASTESADGPKARNDALFRRPATVRVEARDQSHQPAPTGPRPTATVPVMPQPPQPPRPDGQGGPDRRYSANDLLEQLTPTTAAKSTRGLRGMLGLKPSQRESDELRDLQMVKTVFKRPVTVMVANPKGGSGKTPVSILLAAAFGQTRGGGVVAWDNNELRGTLPDRTDSPHRRNIHHLLESLDQLRWSTSQFTDLAHFLNRQDSGNFYTLGSAQEAGHVVTGQNFRQVHELFGRYFQVIIVDTGNNEAAPNWTAAAGEADCLVVPTKWRKDSLIPAARMLESLQDTNPGLLQRTVIAATNGPADSQKLVKSNAASWFGSSHPIVELPMDPHIAEGGLIDYAVLKEVTRRASLRLAAEVATRLVEAGLAAG